MFGLKILSEKRYQALEKQVKGYYGDSIIRNENNEYIRAVTNVIKGVQLPPLLPVNRANIKRIYETSAPVMGVVNYIAENVGEVMRYLELQNIKTGEYDDGHWIMKLLRKPNDRYTLRRFGVAWAVNKLLYGDAWVYAPKAVGKDLGTVQEMYVIPSHKLGVDSGNIKNPIKGIKLLGYGRDEDISSDSIFESFDYNLDDTSYFGTSKIVAAAEYLTMMENGVKRENSSLKNGGVANLITPQPDKVVGVTRPSEADNLEKEVNSLDMANRTKVLRYPVDVHALGNAPVDLNILESHKEAVTVLCFVFKIPVDLYYGQSKYENAKEAKKAIYEQNAIPLANEFAEDLLNYCGLSEEYSLKVNEEKISVLKQTSSEMLENLSKMHASLNELREANGYEKIEEEYADKPMIPMGVMFGEETYDIPSEI